MNYKLGSALFLNIYIGNALFFVNNSCLPSKYYIRKDLSGFEDNNLGFEDLNL